MSIGDNTKSYVIRVSVNYDFIGHFETMKEDTALLLKMTKIDDRTTFPSIHKSTGWSEVLEYYFQVPALYYHSANRALPQ